MSMRGVLRVTCAAVLGLGLMATAPQAQTTTSPTTTQISAVAVIEVERMFSDSLWGKRVAAEIQTAVIDLEEQNRQIEMDLAVEEANLTEMRLTTDPVEFSALADAFDEKVRAIRDATETKVAALNQLQQTEFNRFRSQSEPVLVEVAAEMNAGVIMDKRSVYLSLDAVDITDRVVSRIDLTFGDGSAPE